MKMKKTAQIASLLVTLVMAVNSSTAFAGDNCHSYWPKVPYNCKVVRVKKNPSERADFSAFETGTGTGTGKVSDSNTQYTLRSVSRKTARKLRSQTTKITK